MRVRMNPSLKASARNTGLAVYGYPQILWVVFVNPVSCVTDFKFSHILTNNANPLFLLLFSLKITSAILAK
jgi:hypothetical protein